ncbi:calreticulin [Dendrobium catenatum]|uniref:Calreticulin n=1 Tax=Dendrobium catenatum TaxID=906689 RepID=A0A2I0W7M0_9ASPA|nr:calreticulin [Dendrobium catenatum]PKU71641.1 Calreticulin [Dendrobium catenatum]
MATLTKLSVIAIVISMSLFLLATADVYFEERFDDGWEDRWIKSDWKKSENMSGEWNHTAGKWSGDPLDKGIQTTQDLKYYAISAEFPEFNNKDKTLVFQFSVKHEQKLNCGGGYMKLINGTINQQVFDSDTPYSIMFGPDICGENNKKVHVILSRNGKNNQIKKEISYTIDQLTHLYTLIIRSDATYNILIDNELKQSGSLYSDWDILPPRQIRDPDAKKPEDWEDREFIADENDSKPEGYDNIPSEIPDQNARKPEDWNTEEKGEWKAPMIPNPEYKGPWKQKKIRNPNYKGKWKAPMIDNPEFVDDPDIYVYPNLRYVGIELWQVRAGTLFDNILICDDPEYAKKVAEETWGEIKYAEKAEFEKAEKLKKEEENKLGTPLNDDDDEELDYEEPDWEAKLKEDDEGKHDEL